VGFGNSGSLGRTMVVKPASQHRTRQGRGARDVNVRRWPALKKNERVYLFSSPSQLTRYSGRRVSSRYRRRPDVLKYTFPRSPPLLLLRFPTAGARERKEARREDEGEVTHPFSDGNCRGFKNLGEAKNMQFSLQRNAKKRNGFLTRFVLLGIFSQVFKDTNLATFCSFRRPARRVRTGCPRNRRCTG